MNLSIQKTNNAFAKNSRDKVDNLSQITTKVRFGASSSNNFEDFLHHAEGQMGDAAEGWLVEKALDSVTAGVTAGSANYQKLDKYRKLPPQIAQGEYYLRTGATSQNSKHACELAEREFLDAARTPVNTHRSRGLRMASIAAKLKGDNATARSYFDIAKDSLQRAGGYFTPSNDIHKMKEECNFLANQVAEPVKRLLFAPLRIAEGVARVAADIVTDNSGDLVNEDHYWTTKLTSPFQVKLDEAEKELCRHYDVLQAGQTSDDEWIDGKDRVKLGTSTGKGLRHPYRSIEIAEEKRVVAQRKAAEEVKQAAEAQRKAAEAQRKAAEEARKTEEAQQAAEAAKRTEAQRKAAAEARQAECCKKTSYGIVAVIAMLWGLAALGKQNT